MRFGAEDTTFLAAGAQCLHGPGVAVLAMISLENLAKFELFCAQVTTRA